MPVFHCCERMRICFATLSIGKFAVDNERSRLKRWALLEYSSSVAIAKLIASPEYLPSRVRAWVGDMRQKDFCDQVPAGMVDFVTCVWSLSAIEPEMMPSVVSRFKEILRPGGMVLFRDYASGDITQRRHAKRQLGEDYYARHDDTLVYFFSVESLRNLFVGAGFQEVQNKYVERTIVNHKEDLKMNRRWIQAKFCKPQ